MSAIQIEGMVHVAQFHGLTIIPVDCTSIQNVAPSVSDIVSKITPKTVAVLIAHAFGFIGYSEMDFQDLKQQLISLNIDLIEDCAECFPYRGSCYSDVIFFSFGVIKTCTSLGGGISILRDDNVYHKMKQLQKQYKMQTNAQFFWNKVFKCIFLKWISNLPLLCGILFRICEYVSGDVAGYDKFVTSSVKGFPTGACTSQQRQQQLMRLLRHRPSCTNLALLYRRLTSPIIHFVVKQRIQRCKQIIDDISTKSTKITFPGCEENISNRAGRHYYWLLPIMVDNPDQVTQQLLKAGFDVPR
jgi:dTDP-4-amino-4,6-dideoxygalactose transaminase